MSINVLGLVDCYNNQTFGKMTKNRSIASTSFLGRYAFVDFALSNFLNSGIGDIGILCKEHIRSMTRHVGSGRSWISNTKLGSFSILYDEPNSATPGYNTDISCLIENNWFLKQTDPDYVVIAPPHIIYEVDFAPLIEDHIKSGSKISLLYSHQKGLKTSFINSRKIVLNQLGKITSIKRNKGDADEGDISLDTLIMDYKTLESLIEFAKGTSSFFGIFDAINYLDPSILLRPVKVSGYVRCFDSLPNYLKYSLELLDEKKFNKLFKHDWPIYTKSYDTPPVLYKNGCEIKNSYIANGSIIEGTVINSILGRGVRVKKGAVIKNSVIGSGAIINENTYIENAIVDKEAQVRHVSEVVSSPNDPIYIARGDIV